MGSAYERTANSSKSNRTGIGRLPPYIKRYFDNVDHLGQKVQIHYLNSAAKGDIVEAHSVTEDPTDPDYLLVTWLIGASATQTSGQLDIAIEFYESDDTQCYYRWFTKPATMNIAKGILVSDKNVGITSEILLRIEAALEKIGNCPGLGFGSCETEASVRDKAITGVDTSLPLLDGTTLTVRFTAANTAASPRLTVNGQTSIVYDWRTGQPLTADSLGACTHHFVLYSGAWVLLNPVEAEGNDGKSAYDVAVENGFTGTVQEWLASLQGAPGQDGADGAPGRDGQDGADGGYYTPSVAADGMLSWSGSKEGMPPVAPIDLHDYIDTILPSGYCSTGEAVTDKIESFIDKAIANGSVVSVQFPRANTASSPTLTVNGVKAPILDAGGQPVSPSALGAGRRLFLYSSASPTGWILLNPQTATLPTATAEDAGKAAIVGENGQYDLAYPQMPVVKSLDSNVVMQPNTFYRWGVMDRLTISFGEENPRIVNEFCGEFSSGTPATNFAVPASVNWVNALNIEPNKTYHFSIVNGIGVMMGV